MTGQQPKRLAMESNYFWGLIRINDRVRGETPAPATERITCVTRSLSQEGTDTSRRRRRSRSPLFLMSTAEHEAGGQSLAPSTTISLFVCLSLTHRMQHPFLWSPLLQPSVSAQSGVRTRPASHSFTQLSLGPSSAVCYDDGDAATSLVADRRLSLLSRCYTVVFGSLFSRGSRSL